MGITIDESLIHLFGKDEDEEETTMLTFDLETNTFITSPSGPISNNLERNDYFLQCNKEKIDIYTRYHDHLIYFVNK